MQVPPQMGAVQLWLGGTGCLSREGSAWRGTPQQPRAHFMVGLAPHAHRSSQPPPAVSLLALTQTVQGGGDATQTSAVALTPGR